MRKLVNFRLPILFVLVLIAGIAFGCVLFFCRLSLLYLSATVPAAAVVFIVAVAKSRKIAPAVITVVLAVVFVLSAVNIFARLDGYAESTVKTGRIYEISGKVCDMGKTENAEYAILKNVALDGKSVDGKLIVYLGETYGETCKTGYKINFYGEVEKYSVLTYGRLNPNFERAIKYHSSAYAGVKSEYGFSALGGVREAISNALFENLDKNTAAVCLGLLCGNVQYMQEADVQNFRYGGIAHIFAVSGLHIGIVFGVLNFILRKLTLNKYVSAAICCGFLIFYAGVCGFSPSSVRAVITCTVAVISKLLKVKYDILNTLAAAAFIILLITPASLFSAGLQLSFCAAAGIALLSNPIKKKLKKLPAKISGSVSASLSAQAGTLPVCIANFGYLSGAGVLLNVLIVPPISLLFVPLFIGTFISVIIPPIAEFTVYYCALPISAVISFLTAAGFEKALVTGFGAGAFVPLYYLFLFLASDKINLKRIERFIALSLAAVTISSYCFYRFATPANGYELTVTANRGGGEVLIKSRKGNVLIFTEGAETSYTYSFLSKNYCTKISAIIILGGENCAQFYGQIPTDCKSVYVYGGYIHAQPYSFEIKYETDFEECGINFSFKDGFNVYLEAEGAKAAVSADKNVNFEGLTVDFAPENFKYGDLKYLIKDGAINKS